MDGILLLFMVIIGDGLVYTPMQKVLFPLVGRIPRTVHVKGKVYDIFTATTVTYARTMLAVPLAVSLKYDQVWFTFWVVILHNFLNLLEKVVQTVQYAAHGPVNDTLFAEFMSTLCSKIVGALSLWSLYLVIDPMTFTFWEYVLFGFTCLLAISYEGILAVVKVQDFYFAYYKRFYCIDTEPQSGTQKVTATIMQPTVKEKLVLWGIAFLCLAKHSVDGTSITMPWALYGGIWCLLLSIPFSHASLMRKLDARGKTMSYNDTWLGLQLENQTKSSRKHVCSNGQLNPNEDSVVSPLEDNPIVELIPNSIMPITDAYRNFLKDSGAETYLVKANSDTSPSSSTSDYPLHYSPDCKCEAEFKKGPQNTRGSIGPDVLLDYKVDKVFTIGCFDLFHWGHQRLIMKMRALGHQVIVGVHDSRSINQFKKRVPIETTEKRMLNVRKHADTVFAVPGIDAVPFIQCMINPNKSESCLYIRGDDAPNFPYRPHLERIMSVKLVPKIEGISSTLLRKELYAKANSPDDVIDASEEVFDRYRQVST